MLYPSMFIKVNETQNIYIFDRLELHKEFYASTFSALLLENYVTHTWVSGGDPRVKSQIIHLKIIRIL